MLELDSREGRSRSDLMFQSAQYFISGEINSEVADQQAKMKEIAERIGCRDPQLDGVSSAIPAGLQRAPSNAEPLLRLSLKSLFSVRHEGQAKRCSSLIQS